MSAETSSQLFFCVLLRWCQRCLNHLNRYIFYVASENRKNKLQISLFWLLFSLCRLAVKCCTFSTCTCWVAIISGCSVKAYTCTLSLWWLCLQRSSTCTGTTSWAGVSFSLHLIKTLFDCVLFICVCIPLSIFKDWFGMASLDSITVWKLTE